MIRPTDRGDYYSRRGRRLTTGKRSEPDHGQVISYVRRQTCAEVKIELVRKGKRREFSELVGGPLSKSLKSRR